MRQILYYYYNVNFEIEKKNEDIYILKYNDDVFIFKRLEIDLESLKENIIALNNYHISFHNAILNNKNELISTYQNKNFVLLKVESKLINNWVDFCIFDVDYQEINLGKIWEKKIDYYMNIMSEKGISNLLTIAIFNYYIGMSENAIAIANRLKNKNIKLKRVLSHKRVDYPFDYIKYYDPTEMIIDFRIRDYSEYLKSKILNNDIVIENEYRYITKVNYTNDEINLLFARLLYPSYYFDLLDKVIDNELKEEELNKCFDLTEKYEKFLNDFCRKIGENYDLYIIDWIKK